MFTGIVSTTGRVVGSPGQTLRVEGSFDGMTVGDSIGVNGVCLTVAGLEKGVLVTDISEETARRTNLGSLREGDEVNLELPLAASDRFGGHIVQGHVDGVGKVVEVEKLPASVELTIEVPGDLARYLVEKGSVAVDGVSLTITMLSGNRFGVALIAHTLEATNLKFRKPGDAVNIEVDIVAKYVERMLAKGDQA